MERYRKLVVALIGAAALVASSFGLEDVAGASDEAVGVVNSVIALLTALGVYTATNEES